MVALTRGRMQMKQRVQQYSAVDIESVAADFEMLALELKAVAAAMATQKIRGIKVNGANMHVRAKDELRGFLINAKKSLMEMQFAD